MPRLGKHVRVHPERCNCRSCKKKKKEKRKETRKALAPMYILFIFVMVIGTL